MAKKTSTTTRKGRATRSSGGASTTKGISSRSSGRATTKGGQSYNDEYDNDSYSSGSTKGGRISSEDDGGSYSSGGSTTSNTKPGSGNAGSYSGGSSTKDDSSYNDNNYDDSGSSSYITSKDNSNYSDDGYESGASTKGDNAYDDNYSNDDSYNSGNGKDTGGYSNNEPINDPPPYEDYNDEVVAKTPNTGGSSSTSKYGNNEGEADMTFTEEEVYNDEVVAKTPNTGGASSTSKYGNNEGEADMTFTEEEVYGDTSGGESTSETEEAPTSSNVRGDIYDRFIAHFGDVRFRNSRDINQFFANNSDKENFLDWFGAYIGGRGAWEGRGFRRASATNQTNFSSVWDRISLLYGGNFEERPINSFQFFALVSIMINEVGNTFTPRREAGSLRYMFDTVIPARPARNGRPARRERSKRSYNNFGSANRRNNKTAFELFNDEHFLAAHRNLPLYDRVVNTTNRVWHGSNYPSGFPTDPNRSGIIAEADFYKFSGRGLVQTTWSRSYIQLIEMTLDYNGQNPIIVEYRDIWREARRDGKDFRTIASQTRNAHWDRLFMETNNEYASLAVYCYQSQRENFLQLPLDAQILRRVPGRERRPSPGSVLYVGYRVGGDRGYGLKVKARVEQMMNKLLQDNRN